MRYDIGRKGYLGVIMQKVKPAFESRTEYLYQWAERSYSDYQS